MKLGDTVLDVPKIGPKYQFLLKKLGVETVEDLLYHFPFRYKDFSEIKKIGDLKDGDLVTIIGKLEDVDNIFTKTRKRITKAVLSDSTGKVEIIWFNMHYLKKSLRKDWTYSVSGQVKKYNYKLTFIAPEIEWVGAKRTKETVNTGRLVPVYPETAGISSKWIRTRINDVLGGVIDIPENLPLDLIKKYKFLPLRKALEYFHFPNDISQTKDAEKRFAFEELFVEMLLVSLRRAVWEKKLKTNKLKIKPYRKSLDSFIENLPFKLTDSQSEAIEHGIKDMCSIHPMNRLLEGDVGSGKTVVAMVLAYLAHLNGFKTLYMAPTEILAKQHYETFLAYLEGLGLKIELKTGNSKVVGENADIIVGTHALLFVEDKIPDVGLVVVDEQQRFGVEQRAQIVKLGTKNKTPHVLTMTATPIPRTLALTLYGDLDISSIKPHKDRYKNVKTWIVGEDKRQSAYEWIAKQSSPTFVVCPLIDESLFEGLENVKAAQIEYEVLRKGVFSNLDVGLLHGRMKPTEKEKVVQKFRNGEIQVLVSTPVIEVGIDIPDASIIVIESAERYGLASLHQLRGRVGRRGQDGYCLAFMTKYSKSGFSRLKKLENNHDGLTLSELDMKARGQGELFGTAQHGFKRFKVADPSDLKLLTTVKEEVGYYLKDLDKYKNLKKYLNTKNIEMISKN